MSAHGRASGARRALPTCGWAVPYRVDMPRGCLPPPGAHLHGYHDSVLRLHRWRTAEDSAGYASAVLRGPRVGRVRLGQLPPTGADPHS
jgi:hypothetical protein